MNPRERELLVKQEGNPNSNKIARSQWSSHKNPRIVRVSRSFGGKDRHSKVCTVRGLRDRRIRLSVPTAIQLYDLQDKLGLSQPSKVVDWLLDATKNDIDKLPPLPLIPTFTHFTQSPPLSNPQIQPSLSHFLPSNQPYSKDSLGIRQGAVKISDQRGEIEQDNHEGFGGFVAQNLFPLGNVNQPTFPSMPPYNPYFHWDNNNHPNLPFSYIGGAAFPLPNQPQDQPHNSNLPFPSSSHLYLPPTIPSFPSYITPSMENVQQNPLFSTALHLSSTMKSFPFSKSAQQQQNYTGRGGKEE